MHKKIVTLLLLAVVVLAQFSMASAAPAPVALAGAATVTALPAFSAKTGNAKIDWSITGMPGGATQNIYIWTRTDSANPWSGCLAAGSAATFTSAVGSTNYALAAFNDQSMVEFYVSVDDAASCATPPAVPATSKVALASTFIDADWPSGFHAGPPSLDPTLFVDDNLAACNTFEMWALFSDQYTNGATWATDGYSGLKSWNQLTTGTSAVSAPLGSANDLLSWIYTFPATASGNWSFEINPTDYAGNDTGAYNFRLNLAIAPAELLPCKTFTDTASHADETYIRYLGSLDLIAGNADGSYGPDTTLTRAEAAALFEKANGFTAAGLPATPSAACTFSDVAATDWFAGWVWQACADGFMNGVGGGKFDPSNTLTRGQIVTIFNNIYNMDLATGFYLDGHTACGPYCTTLNEEWNNWAGGGYPELREAAWTDVSVGAYYAIPVVHAYGVGIADGTGATTFSPDQPILRGEFAKMLYRALSRVP